MATKSNIRSLRFDDEVLAIIEGFEGDSFNAKFENLVRYCHLELPKVQARVAAGQQKADKLRLRCKELTETLADLKQLEEMKFLVTVGMGDLFVSVKTFSEKLEEEENKRCSLFR